MQKAFKACAFKWSFVFLLPFINIKNVNFCINNLSWMLVKQRALLKTAAAFNETLERGKGRAGSKLGTWRQRWSFLIKVCISCGMSPCYSKRCKIQKSIYHTKSGNGGRSKTAYGNHRGIMGCKNRNTFGDPMISTTSKSFLSCLNIIPANPTALLFC